MKKLEPRKRLFIHEYLVDLNGTQAAIRAGYSKRGADVQAVRLLRNARIKAAIARVMKRREKKLEITADKWLRELAILGFSDLADYIEINADTGAIRAKAFEEMPETKSRALESIQEDRIVREDAKGEQSIVNEKIKFKLHSKIDALKTIGQHLGFLKDKVEHSGEIKAQVIFVMPRPNGKEPK